MRPSRPTLTTTIAVDLLSATIGVAVNMTGPTFTSGCVLEATDAANIRVVSTDRMGSLGGSYTHHRDLDG